MIAWFSCVPLELSPCSLNVQPCMGGELAKGEEKSTGLLSSCPTVSANGKLLTSGRASVFTRSSLAVGTSFPVLISTPFFFWFLGPLLTPVNKSGDVRGNSSYASQSTLTPAFKHKIVTVSG